MVDWSDLPDDLLNYIATRLYSNVELKRFRSICTSWRSSHSGDGNNDLVSSRPLIDPVMTTILPLHHNEVSLSRAVFFRVTLSSSTTSSQSWLIKSDAYVNSEKFRLLDPFSRLPLQHSFESKSLDLLEFTVSEVRDAYAVLRSVKGETAMEFKKVVLVKLKGRDHYDVLAIGSNGSINYWNGNVWRRLDVNYNKFSDIIVHKGLTYALDSQGVVWWISSDLLVFRYGPSFDETSIKNGCCIEKSFVECCEERLFEEYVEKIKVYAVEVDIVKKRKTVGFKVYKMDEELPKWIEVNNLGDNAIVMATDTCFSVLAHEFYGCMKNYVYFTDKEEKEMKVFKLDDHNGNGSTSITTMSESSKSCFQMFVPSFV